MKIKMMCTQYRLLLAAAMVVALPVATLAQTALPLTAPITAPMICDGDANSVTNGFAGESTDLGSGSMRISASGDLDVRLKGLLPGQTFDCRLVCRTGQTHVFVAACGISDKHGKLLVDVEGFVPPGTSCLRPGLVVEGSENAPTSPSCVVGFGVVESGME